MTASILVECRLDDSCGARHTLIVSSSLDATSVSESEENVSENTRPVPAFRLMISPPELQSQSFTPPSLAPEANLVPSGEKATADMPLQRSSVRLASVDIPQLQVAAVT